MAKLKFTPQADAALRRLAGDRGLDRQLKAVRKALGLMECDLRHQGLSTHKVKGSQCPHGDSLFEAYAQNQTPGAWRIFWCWDRDARGDICILAITPHP